MNWLSTIVRMAGNSFPLSAPLVQLQAELDSEVMKQRLLKLEDPLSALHPDVRAIAPLLYDEIRRQGSSAIEFSAEFYERFQRVLAILENQGCIAGRHALGGKFAGGLRIAPRFMLYICAFAEDSRKMDQLLERVDKAATGRWIHGKPLAEELSLPLPVVNAVFEVFSDRGLGLRSREIGSSAYLPQA